MKLLIACALLVSCLPLPGFARSGTPPPSQLRQTRPLSEIPRHALPATDVSAELAADDKRVKGVPTRYAVGHAVTITPETHGTWEQLPDGRLWRLRVESPGATDLNLGFNSFWLPEGATLHIGAVSNAYYQGPYTAEDNKPHGQLWTPVVPGEAAIIELFVPTNATAPPQLVLRQIGAGHRDMFHQQIENVPKSGVCNIDVACPQAAGWSNEVRSVALYSIYGIQLCTGTMLANARGDFRSYFLTANHCGLDAVNAGSVVVYWNYQSPTCGQHGGGSLAQNQSGATFRAARSDVDFALIELDQLPDPSFNVYYSGWDCSGVAPAGCVGIHHPGHDEKSISISSNALVTVNSCNGSGGINSHWQVIWSAGVTEEGSSGSAIWDSATHLVVGTLSGGGSDCLTPTAADCYGKFSDAYDSQESEIDRLRDWLDPDGSGVLNVPGADPAKNPIVRPAGTALITEGFAPTNNAIEPGETVTLNFALRNFGGVATTNLTATLIATGGVTFPSGPQNYGALPQGSNASRAFTFTATGACGETITPTFQLQDGSRNLGRATFALALGSKSTATILVQNFDSVTAPALPSGWTSSLTGAGFAWATTATLADTLPNAAFAPNPDSISDNLLISPPFTVSTTNAQLTFRHRHDLETFYDGGVLEISTNGSPFEDILIVGGSFATNGYNSTISTLYQNPILGRVAWSGDSGGFKTTTVNLPPAIVGSNVQLCWRLGTDSDVAATGWHIDTVSVVQHSFTCVTPAPLIVNPRLVPPGQLVFSYHAAVGQTYFIESTTNLGTTNWTALNTNAGNGTLQSFTNSTTGSGRRFFRLRAQ